MSDGKRIALVLATIALVLVGVYALHEYQRYLVFSAQLRAWHRDCDVYTTGAPGEGNAGKRACADEMRAILAAAER